MRGGSMVILHRLIGITDQFRVRRIGAHKGPCRG